MLLAGLPLASSAQNTYSLPLVLSADSAGRDSLVRIVNRSFRAGTVRITAIDDTGERFGPVSLALGDGESVSFTSRDLEQGNAAKGLAAGVGDGSGDWRLELDTALSVSAFAFVRTTDGVMAAMHDAVPVTAEGVHRVAFFNPGSNPRRASRLRLSNPGAEAAEVTVAPTDDTGAEGGTVSLTLAAGASRTLTAAELEAGGDDFEGSFGDGAGKWRLSVTSPAAIEVMSLLQSPGHLTNLSTVPVSTDTLPLVLPAGDAGRDSLVRIDNRSGEAGTVRITAIDDTGARFGPVTLALAADAAVNFTSGHLEQGNAAAGLPVGVGDGEGNWRLELDTELDVTPLAYVRRQADGYLAAMHDVVPSSGEGSHRVGAFNPGSNTYRRSLLRLVNPGEEAVDVTLYADDDDGLSAPGGDVSLTLEAGASRMLTAQELEAGGDDFEGSFGDGTGKWRLSIASSAAVEVMNLMRSTSGHLSNVSTDDSTEEPPPEPPTTMAALPMGGTVAGSFEAAGEVHYYSFPAVEDPTAFGLTLSGEVDFEVTAFDEDNNVIERRVVRAPAQTEGAREAVPAVIVTVVRCARSGLCRKAVRFVAVRAKAVGAVVRNKYTVGVAATRTTVRKVRNFLTKSVQWKGDTNYDTTEVLDNPDEIKVTMTASVGADLAIPPVPPAPPPPGRWGTLELQTAANLSHVLNVNHTDAGARCGSGTEYTFELTLDLDLSYRLPVQWRGEPVVISLPKFTSAPLTIVRDRAPRLKADAGELSAEAPRGGEKTVTLTEFIEDPDGGALSFEVSGVPSGWGVTTSGANLTLAAGTGAESGTLTVTATDANRECWSFPMRVAAVESCLAAGGPRTVDPDTLSPGDRFRECAEAPLMVVVPSGSFLMGSPESEAKRNDNEGPVHRVTIARPFAVGVYEVTFDEWDACVSDGGCRGYRPDDERWDRGSRPVIRVSWSDAKAYVRWLSRQTGAEYRLLSESEWEYVARAGTTTPFHWGATITPAQANYDGHYSYPTGDYNPDGLYRGRTVTVGSFAPNAFGLYDVHGNVLEYVEDCWNVSYRGAPSDGSAWTSGNCGRRVLRGGSWFDRPRDLRSGLRNGYPTGIRLYYVGFRVARTLTP